MTSQIALVAALSSVVACATDVDPQTPIEPGDSTVSFFGRLRTFDPADPTIASPIAGATVCLATDDCTTTSADGSYSLAVPRSAELTVRFHADGFGTVDYVTSIDTRPRRFDLAMVRETVQAAFYTQCGSAFPEVDTASILIFGVHQTPVGIEPLEGGVIAASAGSPCYFSGGFLHDSPTQQTTTAAGFGAVALLNVPVASAIDVMLTAGGLSCDRTSASVEAGVQTLLELVCR
jgi:hypothetical protein